MKLYRCGENGVNKTPRGTESPADRTRTGILYLVAVPIGDPDDLSLRARRILGEVDLIASERPESTQRLLAHHSLSAPVTSYGPVHLTDKIAVLMARLHRGAHIALVSDCGTPVLADPGCLLVASARSGGIHVVSVPGPSALTAAAAASGFPCDSLYFRGPLQETKSGIRRDLADCLRRQSPTVLFCTPRSIAEALNALACLASRRRLAVVCDLTQPTEVVVRGTARQVLKQLKAILSTQNITLILAGRKRTGGGGTHRK